jgi:hypothetical protein
MECYKLCWSLYCSGQKTSVCLAIAARQLGARAPKMEGHLRLYAKRYATRMNKPCERQKKPEKTGDTSYSAASLP